MGSSKSRLPKLAQLSAIAEIVPVYEHCVALVRKVHIARKRQDLQAARRWRAQADAASRQITKMYVRYGSGKSSP